MIWRDARDSHRRLIAQRASHMGALRDIIISTGHDALAGEFRLLVATDNHPNVLHTRVHDVQRWDPASSPLPFALTESVWLADLRIEKATTSALDRIRWSLTEATEELVCTRAQMRNLMNVCRRTFERNNRQANHF